MPLADRFDGFLIDLDGVVWVGREPVPGSAETLSSLLEAGKEIAFVTNNPGRPPAAYAERLRGLGVDIGEEQVVTAGMVATRMAAAAVEPGGSAFVIGGAPLKEMVAAAGVALVDGEQGRSAGAVVVSGHRGFDFEELLTAKFALDAGAALIATSHDPTLPMPDGDLPGTGAILAAVETAAGRTAEIAGKPERHLFEMALAALDRDHPDADEAAGKRRVAMVGDRISSDIEGGRRAGLETVLVLSGASTRAEADTADPAPDHVVADLAALLR